MLARSVGTTLRVVRVRSRNPNRSSYGALSGLKLTAPCSGGLLLDEATLLCNDDKRHQISDLFTLIQYLHTIY